MFNCFLLLADLYPYLSHGLYVQGTIDDQAAQEGDVVKNSTSAVGTVKVEIQDENGSALHGFALNDCPEMFADEIEGIKRIFGEENLADIGTASFASDVELPPRFYYLWSSSDPQLPQASMESAAVALDGRLGVVVENTGTQGHVLSNSDMELAQEVVRVLTAE